MSVCVCVRACACVHACLHACVCVSVSVYVCVCVVYVYIHLCMHAHIMVITIIILKRIFFFTIYLFYSLIYKMQNVTLGNKITKYGVDYYHAKLPILTVDVCVTLRDELQISHFYLKLRQYGVGGHHESH